MTLTSPPPARVDVGDADLVLAGELPECRRACGHGLRGVLRDPAHGLDARPRFRAPAVFLQAGGLTGKLRHFRARARDRGGGRRQRQQRRVGSERRLRHRPCPPLDTADVLEGQLDGGDVREAPARRDGELDQHPALFAGGEVGQAHPAVSFRLVPEYALERRAMQPGDAHAHAARHQGSRTAQLVAKGAGQHLRRVDVAGAPAGLRCQGGHEILVVIVADAEGGERRGGEVAPREREQAGAIGDTCVGLSVGSEEYLVGASLGATPRELGRRGVEGH